MLIVPRMRTDDTTSFLLFRQYSPLLNILKYINNITLYTLTAQRQLVQSGGLYRGEILHLKITSYTFPHVIIYFLNCHTLIIIKCRTQLIMLNLSKFYTVGIIYNENKSVS